MKSKMDFKEKVSDLSVAIIHQYFGSFNCEVMHSFVTKAVILVDDLVMKLETMSAQTESLEQFNSEEN